MLAAPKFKIPDAHISMILALVGDGPANAREIQPGLYEISHFSFNELIGRDWNEYPKLGEYSAYGVCDSPAQFLAYELGRFLADTDREFCVSFTFIDKKAQPVRGGWRWHKWGPYIGKGEPEYEYLHDEDGFEAGVYVYHIYEKKVLVV
jgi:hypothetical protein